MLTRCLDYEKEHKTFLCKYLFYSSNDELIKLLPIVQRHSIPEQQPVRACKRRRRVHSESVIVPVPGSDRCAVYSRCYERFCSRYDQRHVQLMLWKRLRFLTCCPSALWCAAPQVVYIVRYFSYVDIRSLNMKSPFLNEKFG